MARERMEFSQHPAVVLLPNPDITSTGIGIVRSLGREGIPIVTIGSDTRPMSAWSRYVVRHYRVPDIALSVDGFVEALCSIGEGLSPKGVLFVSADEHVLLMNRHSSVLQSLYAYNYLGREALHRCIDKDAMYAAAHERNVPVPKTVFAGSGAATNEAAIEELTFPCVVKPSQWVVSQENSCERRQDFIKEFGKKAIRANNQAELLGIVRRARRLPYPVVIQEEVVGGCDQIYGVSLYANRNHEVLAALSCQKTRQYPSDFGTGCCMTSVYNSDVIELSKRLVAATDFTGIAEIEFKYDERDAQYKLMEINPRPGTWITVAPVNGVNTPFIAYEDLTGASHSANPSQTETVVWVDGWLDLLYFLSYRRGDHMNKPLTWLQRQRSLGRLREGAYLTRDDPVPGLVQGWNIAKMVARSLCRRIKRRIIGL